MIMIKKMLLLGCVLLAPTLILKPAFAQDKKNNHDANTEKAVYDLIARILPGKAAHFKLALMEKEGNKDVFELESSNGKIILRGNNGVAMASAFNYYLKNYAHCSITWNGTNLNLPATFPAVPSKIHRATPYTYRYYLNYCTFNYSMSWWDWGRWQKEIDWMAMNGINMPLAITGQNSVWSRVYKSLGFTDKDLESFFSGPAYFNWFYMGNLDGWGGPLPQSLMVKHEELQKKILARERAFGMTPILPAFTGHVPPAFKSKFPDAKVKQTNWSTFPKVNILDPGDKLFTLIGKKFIAEETKTYGTDHLYTADTFNENMPPTNDSTYLSDVSKKVFQSMAEADPKARWIMQGWLFYNDQKFWKPTQIKALLNAVPNDRMIVLDLWTENHPVWNRTDAYYGKPWIWNMLHNFGGNISMYGRMDEIASGPINTLKNPASGNMVGIGLTPEAIEQNPVMYQLMMENVWRDTPINLESWLKEYAYERYGQKNADADDAWKILWKTVYTGGISAGGPESIITGRPTLKNATAGTRTQKNYLPANLVPAWQKLIAASAKLKNSDGFQYDLVDVTRQVLANYADTVQREFVHAYECKDAQAFKKYSNEFLTIITDMDKLLATRKDFLLGKWLEDAKRLGATPQEKRLYEKNARDLITLWGDKNAALHEYSNRQWSGMLNGFYKPRWEQYFVYLNQQMNLNQPIDQKAFDSRIEDWEWNWVNSTDKFADQPSGNSVDIAGMLYRKYYSVISKTYN